MALWQARMGSDTVFCILSPLSLVMVLTTQEIDQITNHAMPLCKFELQNLENSQANLFQFEVVQTYLRLPQASNKYLISKIVSEIGFLNYAFLTTSI